MNLFSKIKYPLLKLIDISGFKVFDPPVRLLYGEEPQKQIRDILRYMFLPILFMAVCMVVWNVVGPNHKTKSGEVPTPGRVWAAYQDSSRFNERENEKERAFKLEGTEREAELETVKAELLILEKEAASLQLEATKVADEVSVAMAAEIEPLKKIVEKRKEKIKADKAKRKDSLLALAEQVSVGSKSSGSLVEAIQKDSEVSDLEKDELKALNTELDEVRDNPPATLKAAQLAANKAADEVQHFKKRIDYLTTGNRSVKALKEEAKIGAATTALSSSQDAKETLKQAKKIASSSEKVVTIGEQEYPRAATIFWQTKRSVATVFVGFILATVIAVPVGVMCGLNRIVMACLTPIISIFRPVSPVVWLLIFQIVIGAFFPDPAAHPLFRFMNHDNNPLAFLQTNPAMIFSACTVAMCALWPALVNTALGVSAIDKDHLNVAKVLRLGFWSRLFKIIIPSSLPLVFAGLRISLGVGWMVLIAAEALSSSDGLGKFVWDEYQNGSSQSFANIILACFVVGIIGFFLDRLMIILQKLVSFDDGSATA